MRQAPGAGYGAADERGIMRVRDLLRSWLAAALTWVVLTLLSQLAYGATLAAGDIDGGILVSWAAIVLMPVLSAVVATVLLPVPARRGPLAWLLAGVPVTLVALVLSMVRAVGQDRPVSEVGAVPLLLVLLAAGAAVLTGLLKARGARPSAVPATGPSYSSRGGAR